MAAIPATRTSASAPVLEVFASVQGEGLHVGMPQVFVRLRGCPLRCRWCDTPGSWTLDDAHEARVAKRGAPRREPAWATPFQVACWVAEVEPGARRAVSVTGGEPLAWPEFVLALGGVLGGRPLHLETAGAHPRALARVLPVVAHVSLDLKLPDDLDAPRELGPAPDEPAPRDADAWAAAREACLRLLRGHAACAKLLVAGGRQAEEFEELLLDVARLAPDLPLIVQPVTPMHGVRAPTLELCSEVLELALEQGLHARLIPQVHRLLGAP